MRVGGRPPSCRRRVRAPWWVSLKRSPWRSRRPPDRRCPDRRASDAIIIRCTPPSTGKHLDSTPRKRPELRFSADKGWLATPLDLFMRSLERPFARGNRVDLGDIRVTGERRHRRLPPADRDARFDAPSRIPRRYHGSRPRSADASTSRCRSRSDSDESSRTSLLRRIAEVENVCDSYLPWFRRSSASFGVEVRHESHGAGRACLLVLPLLRQRSPKRFAPRSRRPGLLSPRPRRTTGTGGSSRVRTRAMRRCGCCGRPMRTRPASRPRRS